MAAHQAPPSLGFSRQEHCSGLPFPSPVHESEKWKWSCSVVSNSSRPHGLQPTRFLRPWDFPGKRTGVGCHCLPQHPCITMRNRAPIVFNILKMYYEHMHIFDQLDLYQSPNTATRWIWCCALRLWYLSLGHPFLHIGTAALVYYIFDTACWATVFTGRRAERFYSCLYLYSKHLEQCL